MKLFRTKSDVDLEQRTDIVSEFEIAINLLLPITGDIYALNVLREDPISRKDNKKKLNWKGKLVFGTFEAAKYAVYFFPAYETFLK